MRPTGSSPTQTPRQHEDRYGDASSIPELRMTITDDQRRILRDINATTPISESETDWAVNAGYAALAEDGDIDLTQEGRALLDAA